MGQNHEEKISGCGLFLLPLQGARGVAMSVGCGVNWLANFLVGVSFEHLQKAVGSLCFLPFIIISFIFWCFSVVKMPETKNKTFTDINAIFEKRAGIVAGNQS